MSISRLMQMAAAGAGGEYQISRSLRFNSADSAYLSRTPASASNRKTWTWSGWVKRTTLSSTGTLFAAGASSVANLYVLQTVGNQLAVRMDQEVSANITTTQVFRDVSAWYHFVIAVDTAQATGSNRVKIYVNGLQITAFDDSNYPSQDFLTAINNNVAHEIGLRGYGPDLYLNSYLTEINFIDGQQLTPSSFGETNETTGVWSPIAYAGSYGTNGFYLNFSDNSDVTAATLGADYSGNGNNWTPSGSPGFSVTAGAGNDSLVDTPTQYGTDTGAGGEVRGNYCTNFGQRPFAYTAPSGFKALVTTNLPEPTVVQGDDYFNTVLYTGTGAAGNAVTGVGFAPDWVWLKSISQSYSHALFDVLRGRANGLISDSTSGDIASAAEMILFLLTAMVLLLELLRILIPQTMCYQIQLHGAGKPTVLA
jgi:hypothetical protein